MTMTTRKRTPATTSGTVTVTVVEPHLVYHDGEQRSGTLTNVPADTAEHWQRHGWVTVVDDKPNAPTKTQAKTDKLTGQAGGNRRQTLYQRPDMGQLLSGQGDATTADGYGTSVDLRAAARHQQMRNER